MLPGRRVIVKPMNHMSGVTWWLYEDKGIYPTLTVFRPAYFGPNRREVVCSRRELNPGWCEVCQWSAWAHNL